MTIFMRFVAACLLSITLSQLASAQSEKYFHGLYLGGEIGYRDLGSNDGFAYGGYIGGRYQNDAGWVYGLQADINGIANEEASDSGAVSLNAIVGKAFGPEKRSLIFVGVGGEAAFSLDDVQDSFLNDEEGINVVAGYERALTRFLNLRIQGRYSNLGQGIDGFGATAGLTLQF